MKQFIITFEDLNGDQDIMCITAEDSIDAEVAFWEVTQEEHMVVDAIVGINEFNNDDEVDAYGDWFYECE
jgi:hypothetical protein